MKRIFSNLLTACEQLKLDLQANWKDHDRIKTDFTDRLNSLQSALKIEVPEQVELSSLQEAFSQRFTGNYSRIFAFGNSDTAKEKAVDIADRNISHFVKMSPSSQNRRYLLSDPDRTWFCSQLPADRTPFIRFSKSNSLISGVYGDTLPLSQPFSNFISLDEPTGKIKLRSDYETEVTGDLRMNNSYGSDVSLQTIANASVTSFKTTRTGLTLADPGLDSTTRFSVLKMKGSEYQFRDSVAPRGSLTITIPAGAVRFGVMQLLGDYSNDVENCPLIFINDEPNSIQITMFAAPDGLYACLSNIVIDNKNKTTDVLGYPELWTMNRDFRRYESEQSQGTWYVIRNIIAIPIAENLYHLNFADRTVSIDQ